MDVVAKYDTPAPEAGADKELLSEKFSRMLLYLKLYKCILEKLFMATVEGD